jgi:hypothetical protein
MNKMIKAIKLLLRAPEPIDHSITDKMVSEAVANTVQTVRKIKKFNIHLEKTQTYYIAKALGQLH